MKRTILPVVVFMASLGAGPAESREPKSATVPMTLDHHRLTVPVEFVRADGSVHQARAWVDSGGTEVIVSQTLAREMGVDLSAMPVPVPILRLGGIALDTEGMSVSVHPGCFARPGVQADCVLPARCLRRLHVVFDYPAKRLTVAQPGDRKPLGAPVPIQVNPDTGLFMVEATIDGETVGLGVDTGSSGTWVSEKLTAAWISRHRDWPHAVGAAGSTNFFGFPFETQGTLLFLPDMRIGQVAVPETAVLGLDQGLFDWYSKKSAGAVAGFVGADLISGFRLEVDFPNQMSWWQAGPPRRHRDLDIVGVSLKAEVDGSFTVAGVVSRAGQPSVAGVEPGDKLLAVEKLAATGAPMGAVIQALRGKPDSIRRLRLERAGKAFTVRATVVRLP